MLTEPSTAPTEHLQTLLQGLILGGDPEDLHLMQPALLTAAAQQLYDMAIQRPPQQASSIVWPFVQSNGARTWCVLAVNDDMPFLVDSVSHAISQYGLLIDQLLHPIFSVARTEGRVSSIEVTDSLEDIPGRNRESFLFLTLEMPNQPDILAGLIQNALQDVRACVNDEARLRALLHKTRDGLLHAPHDIRNVPECAAFLDWMDNHHFVLLGAITTHIDPHTATQAGLGVLRDPTHPVYSLALGDIPQQLGQDPQPLILTKANVRATVHRAAYLDCVLVACYDETGTCIGRTVFVGLYTANAYHSSPRTIPLLRQWVRMAIERSGFIPGSYRARVLENVLAIYPRDDWFSSDAEVLIPALLQLVRLQERPRVKLQLHIDRFARYVSAMIFIPRDNFDHNLRNAISRRLEAATGGDNSDYNVQLSDLPLARLHFLIRCPKGIPPTLDPSQIEAELTQLIRGWNEVVRQRLDDKPALAEAAKRMLTGVPPHYRNEVNPDHAARDMQALIGLSEHNPLGFGLRLDTPLFPILQLYRRGAPLALSEILPRLTQIGLSVTEEHTFLLNPSHTLTHSITNLKLLDFGNKRALKPNDTARIEALLLAVWQGRCESDALNRLVLNTRLDWRKIDVLRSYIRYLRQTGLPFGLPYLETCVLRYPNLAEDLINFFEFRLSPLPKGKQSNADHPAKLDCIRRIQLALSNVMNLDEDRILGGLFACIEATVRTNFWQSTESGDNKPYLALKIASSTLAFLPEPRPLFETFVTSPRMEGIHLRASKVARGGIRWSDRPEDFRTEILGLLKAQMIKNAVIVPMGAKGGFVVKNTKIGREAIQAEGIICYQTLISGLLDLADNLINDQAIPPIDVRCRDEIDAYLVVAADKGTASFSDIANQRAKQYGFWLGDAFASGGSDGYDHKKMGITARGAWEATKRHCAELGLNTHLMPFTVIGIGDMSGDVFGNGMLLSPQIKLLAAFDHRHIFLDPNPDPASSFTERQRLFALPRSAWLDYNPALISSGGGVFARDAKSIELSPQVKAWLGLTQTDITPPDLIRRLLCCRVDVLYNGGIGTYIKASTQSHSDVGDRNNDNIRVNGNELKARVLIEGGNLGATQAGRIEFALAGGRVQSDAIDNAGGVDCSDHEVNIKILLGLPPIAAQLKANDRHDLLLNMTEDVAHRVLRNNYLQMQALAISLALAPSLIGTHARLMRQLEQQGQLNRKLEALPSEEVLSERRGNQKGLTKPELAVLMAHTKIRLCHDLLATPLPDEPTFEPWFFDYFPATLCQQFQRHMLSHPLKREIIANQLSNVLVNRMGNTFIFRLQEETNETIERIVRAWHLAQRLFDANGLYRQIEALDGQINPAIQTQLFLETRALIERATRWLLREKQLGDRSEALLITYETSLTHLIRQAVLLLPGSGYPLATQQANAWQEAGVPPALAHTLARHNELVGLLNVIDIQPKAGIALELVAVNYYAIARTLELNWLRNAITALPRDNRWQSLARTALRDDLSNLQRELTLRALTEPGVEGASLEVEGWLLKQEAQMIACLNIVGELQSYQTPDLAMLSAGLREISKRLLH